MKEAQMQQEDPVERYEVWRISFLCHMYLCPGISYIFTTF